MKGVKFLRYNDRQSNPNHIIIKTDEWGLDKGLEPFFYVHGINRREIYEWDFYSDIRDIQDDNIKIFWTGEELDVLRVITEKPSAVGRLGALIPEMNKRASVFSADVPYLRNYLIHSNTYIYDGVKELDTIIVDIEADVYDLDKQKGVPLLIGISEGKFDLEKLQYIEKEQYALQDKDKVQMCIDASNLILSKDLLICHNVGFDVGLLSNFLRENKYYKFKTKKEKIFQGAFRFEEVTVPVDCAVFDTIHTVGISLRRPKTSPHNLKRLVDSLEIRDYSRVEIEGKKIASTFRSDPSLVEKYCLHDIEDTKLLFNYVSPAIFVPSIEAGILAQTLLFTGNKVVWETILMRKCFEFGCAIPHFSKKAKTREKEYACPHIVDLPRIKGGFTIKPKKIAGNVLKDVYHIDVVADYPNVIMQYNISPETVFLVDSDHIFDDKMYDYYKIEFDDKSTRLVGVVRQRGLLPELLEPILNNTVELKELSKKDHKYKQAYLGYKGFRNSSFGFMGIREGDTRFPNKAASGLITQIGREIMETVIEVVENYTEEI